MPLHAHSSSSLPPVTRAVALHLWAGEVIDHSKLGKIYVDWGCKCLGGNRADKSTVSTVLVICSSLEHHHKGIFSFFKLLILSFQLQERQSAEGGEGTAQTKPLAWAGSEASHSNAWITHSEEKIRQMNNKTDCSILSSMDGKVMKISWKINGKVSLKWI